MNERTQEQIVLNHLKEIGGIDTHIANHTYYITRLGAVIKNLEDKKGIPIKHEWVHKGQKSFIVYKLIGS